MIVLCFNMQGEDIIEHTNGKTSVMCLHFHMQEEDILEYTNAKCHEMTLMVKLLIISVA